MVAKIRGTGVVPATIDLYALFGEFKVSGSPYTIKYASTFGRSSSPGHQDLLRELKPVRERLSPSELRDLGSLLQRDLNDSRVASELVPYLRGDRADIGFFPAVLAVLVPNGFFASDGGVEYPSPERGAKENMTSYQGCWTTERFVLDPGGAVPLGKLQIVQDSAEIIVLDGQHRASAFRYLSGDWDPHGEIYEAFYHGAGGSAPLDADLPVTIIWFEAEDGARIQPRQISRQLFVDVNNSAKPVSAARTILLDDRTITAVAVQQVYNMSAEEGFDTGKFSLLHNAFDMDSDLAKGSLPKFSLTTPEILHEALHWALFCNEGWKQLTQWRVQRRRSQKNTDRISALLGSEDGIERGPDEDENLRFYFTDAATARQFADLFSQQYVPAFAEMFNGLDLLNPHYEAAQEVERWIADEATVPLPNVWDKVFTGGEGLYWSFQASGSGAQRRNYQQGIAEIEKKFSDERSSKFGGSRTEIDNLYRSIATKAFQTGFVMAIDYLFDKGVGEGNFGQTGQALVSRLNEYEMEQWRAIFSDLRPIMISGTDPKAWPAYRNLLLRMYDGDSFQILDKTKLPELPEWQALSTKLSDVATALATTEDDMPSDSVLKKHVEEQIPVVEGVFAACGLESDVLQQNAVKQKGIAELKGRLRKEFPEDEDE